MNFFKKNGAGLLLCLLIAIPSWLLGKAVPVVGGPVFSILIGMIVTLILTDKTVFSPGINFTSKKILQTAVVFLGFGMNLTEILAKGKQSLPIILSTITTSLVIAFIMYKILHINSNSAVLVGVGSSICGGSAIAATAPVIGADDEEIAQSISVIFLFNVIAALVFPSLGAALGLTNEGFGLFAGTAINDTSSVTAAATAWDGIHASNTLEAAAIVKMTRTLAIIPITLVLAIYKSRKSKNTEGSSFSLKRAFPMFVLFFVLASVVTTIFHLPAGVTAPLKELSKFLIIMAMSAIGLNTNIVKLVRTGMKPILTGFCCWIGIAFVSLMMQHILGIWENFTVRQDLKSATFFSGGSSSADRKATLFFFLSVLLQLFFFQDLINTYQLHTQYKNICCHLKFLRSRIRRSDTDIAVMRIFSVRERSSCTGQHYTRFFCLCHDRLCTSIQCVKGDKITSPWCDP